MVLYGRLYFMTRSVLFSYFFLSVEKTVVYGLQHSAKKLQGARKDSIISVVEDIAYTEFDSEKHMKKEHAYNLPQETIVHYFHTFLVVKLQKLQ